MLELSFIPLLAAACAPPCEALASGEGLTRQSPASSRPMPDDTATMGGSEAP